MPKSKGGYYEKGFSPQSEVEGLEYKGEGAPGYLEGHNASAKAKKYDYEADGPGKAGPAAR